jgi:hypothetical protein
MRGDQEELERQKQLDVLSDRAGLFILSAAAPNRSAYEYPKLEHGLLTYSLLRSLKINASIYERDEYVNMTKWFYQTGRDLEGLTSELGLKQEATASGTSDFQLMRLNESTRSKIELAEKKQQLFFSDAENELNESSDQDLLRRLVRRIEDSPEMRKCFYVNEKYSPGALVVKIKYKQKGDKIQCRILFNENNVNVGELRVSDHNGDWDALEQAILTAIQNRQCP